MWQLAFIAVEDPENAVIEEPVPFWKTKVLALAALVGISIVGGLFVVFVWVIDLNAVDHESDPEFRSFAIILTLVYLGVAGWFLRVIWRHFK
jgi:hypothetical protein